MESRTIALLFVFILLSTVISAQRTDKEESALKKGNPADNLPSYIKMVSGFGERPDWSRDNKKILFVSKPMGEVYELELETGIISPKTRHFNHYGFTRAMYLVNGDILLSGPIVPFDPTDPGSRNYARDHCWLSIMDGEGTKKPVPLDIICAERPAVSRQGLKIGWAVRDRQRPELGNNRAQLFIAKIQYEQGLPRAVNQKMVFDSKQMNFPLGGSSLETQSFVPDDDIEMTFSVYQINDGRNTDTYLINTETGEFENLTRSPDYYDEPEGVFPDGKHTCVEHGSSLESAWPLIDLYKLKLDGSGEMQRLTYFTEFEGYKASQGVVSDDGRYLCFQIGKSGDEAGVGYGFFIMDLEKAAPHLEPFTSYARENFVE